MSIRKTRVDKGRARKPAPTEREAWRNYFRAMNTDDQQFELGYLTAIREARTTEPMVSATASQPLQLEIPEQAPEGNQTT